MSEDGRPLSVPVTIQCGYDETNTLVLRWDGPTDFLVCIDDKALPPSVIAVVVEAFGLEFVYGNTIAVIPPITLSFYRATRNQGGTVTVPNPSEVIAAIDAHREAEKKAFEERRFGPGGYDGLVERIRVSNEEEGTVNNE